MADFGKIKKQMSPFQIIIFGFAGLILGGALLLMLPFASIGGTVTPFGDALFTSTSAVCVTGLVVRDTASYWSPFGQLVILILIQIGGMGVITVAVAFSLLSGKRISLLQRSAMCEALAAPAVGGIVRLTGFLIRAALAIELIGAVLMMPAFCRDFGLYGIWMAVFHSVSAFCNAGFDLMGTEAAPFASLVSYRAEPLVCIPVMLLIVTGGIGFLTWDDIRKNGRNFRRYRLQSKVALSMTAMLIALPALYFYFFEFSSLPPGERVLASLFQSVTPRTAGFNTADLTLLTGAGQGIMIVLMLIGGSPGSTAGGMKTTTAAVLFANVRAVFGRRENVQFFGRRIGQETVSSAATVLIMYLSLFFGGALAISLAEGLPVGTCLFEAASAVGTVGLSLGLTSTLGTFSRAVLIALMFLGRVGGLTFIYAAFSEPGKNFSRLPLEKITVG